MAKDTITQKEKHDHIAQVPGSRQNRQTNSQQRAVMPRLLADDRGGSRQPGSQPGSRVPAVW